MQYVANTPADKKEMLEAIGVRRFDDLLKDIPRELSKSPMDVGKGLSEMELISRIKKKGQKNSHSDRFACFLGAGVYDHYIPPVVNVLASRGEFITAYTPYQGEASQGTLQTIYEYQTMICLLTGMDVANASMYDGASALAEAVTLALRHTGRNKIFLSDLIHPEYIETVKTYISNLDVEIVMIPSKGGVTDVDFIRKNITGEEALVAFQTPNFLGYLENGKAVVDLCKTKNVLTAVCVNPLALSVIAPPGSYGADIVVGEGQPLGNPMSYGGPHFGFFAVKESLMRKIPGRIAGLTRDLDGNRAFVLTLQAREQHIRREKATSNICTNHALCALKAVIFLSVLGPHGFKRMGHLNLQQSRKAVQKLTALSCVKPYSQEPFFNEFTIQIDKDVKKIKRSCTENKVIGPLHLGRFDKTLDKHYLVAVTEQRSDGDIDQLVEAIENA